MFNRVLILGAGIAAGLLFANLAFAQSAPPRGNAGTGKTLFENVGCFQCHGFAGQGGGAGPKLVDPVMAYEAFAVQIRTPRQQMPPYTARVLSDQQVADIYAHLLTIPKSPDAASIPMLRN